MEEEDTDWERAHLKVERNELGRETPTGRERTLEWEWCGGERHRLGESALDRVGVVWARKSSTGKGRT